MKQRVLLLLVLISFLFNQSHAQIKWQLKDSVIKFPSNFNSWIERNVGKYNPYNDPLGTRIPSFQLKETGDFNKDGYTDLCMELYLRVFDTNNPQNPNKYQDSLMNYYKGIFINQKNGTYLLDTNYIIQGRGAIWDGGFGDFNGDGLIDYYNNCVYYEADPKYQDFTFYKYSNKTYSPSHVYFNNGKSFDRIDLDTVDMNTTNSDIVDINKELIGHESKVLSVSSDVIGMCNQIQNFYAIDTVYSHIETGILTTYVRDKEFKRYCRNNNISWKENINNGVQRGLQHREKWYEDWEFYMKKKQEIFNPLRNQILKLEEIKEIELKLDGINEQLATRTDYESEGYSQLILDLTEFTERYELLGGYNYQGDTEKILQGLGFQREDFDKLTDTFSGGWRMRIELAKLLLQNNDILLLDEPTNHLDIESIIWLENFLKSYSGAIVLVSHDKMFLDNVTNRTIEISLGQIYDYKKPYSQFLLLRAEIKEKQLQAQKNQEKHLIQQIMQSFQNDRLQRK